MKYGKLDMKELNPSTSHAYWLYASDRKQGIEVSIINAISNGSMKDYIMFILQNNNSTIYKPSRALLLREVLVDSYPEYVDMFDKLALLI